MSHLDGFDRVVADISVERQKQDEKWGVQDHLHEWWNAILGEEAGEVSKALLEWRFGNKPASCIRQELVQVAAVAVAWLQCIDRHEHISKEIPPGIPAWVKG